MVGRLGFSDVEHGALALKPVGESEFHVELCGVTVGEIMRRKRSFGRAVWFWSLSGPHIPATMTGAGSNAQTLGGAQQAIKRLFDAWLQSATGRTGNMVWQKPSTLAASRE